MGDWWRTLVLEELPFVTVWVAERVAEGGLSTASIAIVCLVGQIEHLVRIVGVLPNDISAYRSHFSRHLIVRITTTPCDW